MAEVYERLCVGAQHPPERNPKNSIRMRQIGRSAVVEVCR